MHGLGDLFNFTLMHTKMLLLDQQKKLHMYTQTEDRLWTHK